MLIFWGEGEGVVICSCYNQLKPFDVLSVIVEVHLYRVLGERRAHLLGAGYYGAGIFCWAPLPLALINVFYS